MSIEAELRNVIGPMVGDRVYPDTAPADAGLPFVIYQQIGGQPLNFLAGVPDKENGRFQVVVWSDDREQANQLLRDIRATLCVAPLQAVVMTGVNALLEPETDLRGAQQDFSIWFAV